MSNELKPTDQFYNSQKEPERSCFLALREIISTYSQDISETKKYGMPCFCYSKKPLVYLWTDKTTNEPYILFVDGDQMHHPALEQGSRSKMKILPIPLEKDINKHLIKELLQKAILLKK